MTTLHELLKAGAMAFDSRPAIHVDEHALSYGELLRRCETAAAALRELGVSEADHVAIIMENSLECVTSWLASSIIGCTEVPINPEYRGDLLVYLLKDSGTTVVICDGPFAHQIAEVCSQVPTLRMILVNGAERIDPLDGIQVVDLASCLGTGRTCPVATTAPERVILYTSGTTGPSKGVVHTQRSLLTLARYNAQMLEYGPDDRLLNFFPLYHQNARYTGVIPALSVGASIRLERRFSSSAFWQTCDRDGTTAFNYLGSVLRLILNATPPERTAGTHTIRKAFGAGATPAAWRECENRLGIRLVETYGLSEAPMATLNTDREGRRSPIGSAGRASDLFEIAIVDAEDRIAGPDVVGEIVMRPKQPDAIMVGYHNKEAATVHAFRNLWFHSGDRGRLSPLGDLYFEERAKDSIRRRGENISAWEVESVLDLHPDVVESAVYGLPSADTDEDVVAALVLRRADANLAEILKFAQERLPRYAVPTLFRIMKDLPRTPTAKVQKAELRAEGRKDCIPTAPSATAASTPGRPSSADGGA